MKGATSSLFLSSANPPNLIQQVPMNLLELVFAIMLGHNPQRAKRIIPFINSNIECWLLA